MGRKVLVIANHTLGAPQLDEAIQTRLKDGPCQFHVLAPATPSRHKLPSDPDEFPDDVFEGSAVRQTSWERARQRLYAELDRLHQRDIEASGEVCEADPLEAVKGLVAKRTFDEIILSTLPAGISRWLHLDLPSRLQRAVHMPVTVIIAPEDED